LCEYCLIHESDTFLGCQVEHVISEKHGGQTAGANLALACVFCNRFKGTDIAALTPSGKLSRLFNPRADHWRDHFRLDQGQIVAITDVGAATVGLLRMNHPDRVLERQVLAKVGRYPPEAAIKRLRG
jgi:hypothetical protein